MSMSQRDGTTQLINTNVPNKMSKDFTVASAKPSITYNVNLFEEEESEEEYFSSGEEEYPDKAGGSMP
jgi:hypothetical protein